MQEGAHGPAHTCRHSAQRAARSARTRVGQHRHDGVGAVWELVHAVVLVPGGREGGGRWKRRARAAHPGQARRGRGAGTHPQPAWRSEGKREKQRVGLPCHIVNRMLASLAAARPSPALAQPRQGPARTAGCARWASAASGCGTSCCRCGAPAPVALQGCRGRARQGAAAARLWLEGLCPPCAGACGGRPPPTLQQAHPCPASQAPAWRLWPPPEAPHPLAPRPPARACPWSAWPSGTGTCCGGSG